MYKNSKLDNCLKEANEKNVVRFPSVVISILGDYYKQRGMQDLNPFDMLLLSDVRLDETNFNDFLSFLYVNGVRSFIWCNESTSSLQSLALMLKSGSYRIEIRQSIVWLNSMSTKNYGLVIDIKRRRGA